MVSVTDPSNPAASVGDSEDYRLLLEISRVINASRTPRELYRAVYRETTRALEADGFYISLFDPRTDRAHIVYAVDRGEEREPGARYPGSESEVIRTGRGILVSDCRDAIPLRVVGEADDEPVRSLVSVPLRHAGKIKGVMSVQSYRPNAYSGKSLALLEAIANITAVAVDNAHHVEELRQRRQEAERIEEIGRDLTSSLELEVVLDRIVDATQESLGVDSVTVWILRNRVARIGASKGGPLGREDLIWEVDPSMLERLESDLEPLLLSELAAEELPPEFRASGDGRDPCRSGMLVPLRSESGITGILSAGSSERRALDEHEVRIMTRLGRQAAVAIENARLHENAETLSLTDPLTGLPNRRHLMIHLEREVAAARRGRPLAVVIFDLDHFKPYNDTFGHLAGDEILKLVARILASESRAMNFSGRFGGDEFISVISDAEPGGARAHAERICERVRNHPKLAGHGLTLSYGIARFGGATDDADDLIDAADEELYRAKGDRGRGGDRSRTGGKDS